MIRSLPLVAVWLAITSSVAGADEYRSLPPTLAPAQILRQIAELKQQRLPDYSPNDHPADPLDRYVAGLWPSLGLSGIWNGKCACSALLLEEEPFSRYVTLRVGNGGWSYRFIVFLAPLDARDSWQLLGYADTESKYAVPTHRIYRTRHGTFLIVSEDTGGTGLHRKNEAWYELDSRSSRQVLEYPVRGHENPFVNGGILDGRRFGVSREWEGKSHPPDEQDSSVKVDLTVRYSSYFWEGGEESALLTRTQTAVFTWDEASRSYRLDADRSSLTRNEFLAVYNFDLSLQQFIRYNADELRGGSNPIAAELLEKLGQ